MFLAPRFTREFNPTTFLLKVTLIGLAILTAACGGGATSPGAGYSTAGVTLAPVRVTASPTGSSSADCSDAMPCSLAKARDTVRTMNRSMKEDIVVYLRGGRYALDSAFTLDASDSGMNGRQVVYQAYPGDTPVLSGGVKISNWVLHDAAKNIYRATAPAGLHTRQMYVDGLRAQRARGIYNPPGFTKTATGYAAPDAGMASWRNPSDIEFVHSVQWQHYRCSVASISGTTVTMDQPCWYHATVPQQIHPMALPNWVENAYELLDEQGEWYHDRAANTIYYIPRTRQDMARAEVIVPVLETLVRVAGTADNPVRDIAFQGITFAHATWLKPSSPEGYPSGQAGQSVTGNPAEYRTVKTPGNVVFHRVQNVLLERNVFEHLGAAALAIEAGSKNTKVIGNVFRDISSTGIALGDTDQPNAVDVREITKDNVIRNNYITRACQEFYSGVGIFVAYAENTTIDHNELDNLPYSGISVGWGWGGPDPSVAKNNKITNNRVHHVMQRLEDGGMIYTLGAQPESVITGNYLSNQTFNFGGIYLDQGTQFFTIGENVVTSSPYWFVNQVLLPPAQNNTVLNNYSDAPFFFQIPSQTGYSAASIAANAWPAPALAVMQTAGLEEAFKDIRADGMRIEAEAYDQGPNAKNVDLTPGNAGGYGIYRWDDVDIYPCWSCSNDFVVGQTQTGEYLSYSVYIDKDGIYDFEFAVATAAAGDRIQLVVDSQSGGQAVDLPHTGGWGSYQTVALKGIALSKGPHVLATVFTTSAGFGFDYFTYRAQ